MFEKRWSLAKTQSDHVLSSANVSRQAPIVSRTKAITFDISVSRIWM